MVCSWAPFFSACCAAFTPPPQALSSISTSSCMKKTSWFITALVGGFALVLGLAIAAFYLNLGVPTESSRWCYEINEKKRHLAANISSPKLLLVGGSSTLFGISAREIQSH